MYSSKSFDGLPISEKGYPLRENALINYDALVNADRTKVARKTVLLFDPLQLKNDKETNVLALACAFILLCKRFKINVQDAFTAAGNLMTDRLQPEGTDHRFAAIAMHLKDDYR